MNAAYKETVKLHEIYTEFFKEILKSGLCISRLYALTISYRVQIVIAFIRKVLTPH